MKKRTYQTYEADYDYASDSDAMDISTESGDEETYSVKKPSLANAINSTVIGVSIHNTETEVALFSGFIPPAYESFTSVAQTTDVKCAHTTGRIAVVRTIFSPARAPHIITPSPHPHELASNTNYSPVPSNGIHRVTPFSCIAGNDSKHPIIQTNSAFKQQQR